MRTCKVAESCSFYLSYVKSYIFYACQLIFFTMVVGTVPVIYHSTMQKASVIMLMEQVLCNNPKHNELLIQIFGKYLWIQGHLNYFPSTVKRTVGWTACTCFWHNLCWHKPGKKKVETILDWFNKILKEIRELSDSYHHL